MNDAQVLEPQAYVITEGQYSDYHVVAVFRKREDAEDALEKIAAHGRPYEDPRIEVFPINRLPQEVIVYRVTVDGDGDEIRRERFVDTENGRHTEPYVYGRLGYSHNAISAQSIRGYDVALKAARDRLAQLKAEEQGVT